MLVHIDYGMRYLDDCALGDLKSIKELLTVQSVAVDFTDREGNNALHYAARANQRDVLKYLTQKYVNFVTQFSQTNNDGKTPLELANAETRAFITDSLLPRRVQARMA